MCDYHRQEFQPVSLEKKKMKQKTIFPQNSNNGSLRAAVEFCQLSIKIYKYIV